MVAREVDRQVRLLCSARRVWQGCAAAVVFECLCTLWTMLVGFDVCQVLYDICGVSPGQKSAHSTMYYTLDTSRSHKKKIFLIYLIEYTVLCTAGSLCMCRCT